MKSRKPLTIFVLNMVNDGLQTDAGYYGGGKHLYNIVDYASEGDIKHEEADCKWNRKKNKRMEILLNLRVLHLADCQYQKDKTHTPAEVSHKLGHFRVFTDYDTIYGPVIIT